MSTALSELYQLSRTAPVLTAQLPAELGRGTITRLTTTHGIGLSTWHMRYDRDTYVAGEVGDEVRLLFCLGEGVEWRSSAHDRVLRLDPCEACLCLGDYASEAMCYGAGAQFAFHSVSIPRVWATALLNQYLPGDSAPGMLRELNTRPFPVAREIRAVLETFRDLNDIGDGLGMMRTEGRVHELLALCMEGAMGDRPGNLRPDDAALVKAVQRKIDADPAAAPNIAALSRTFGVSPSKLTRDFKRQFGLSLHAYVIECRLREAARLLASGAYTVGEVAERVGYVKAGQFTEAFKHRFGVLPRDY